MKNIKIKIDEIKFYLVLGSLTAPTFVFAQPTVQSILLTLGDIIGLLIPLVVALALLYFFWGLAKFISNTGGGKEQEEAKGIMLWGIIALFVMVSVWGIIRIIGETLFDGIYSDAIPIDHIIPGRNSGVNNPIP